MWDTEKLILILARFVGSQIRFVGSQIRFVGSQIRVVGSQFFFAHLQTRFVVSQTKWSIIGQSLRDKFSSNLGQRFCN